MNAGALVHLIFPGTARLSEPAAVDQNEHVSSSFFLLIQVEAKRITNSGDHRHSTKKKSPFDVLSSR